MSRGVKLVADFGISENTLDENYDAIILPGGIKGAENFSKNETFISILKNHFNQGRLLAAICASPALVLEPHGFLEEKDATAYPALVEKLSNQSKASERVVLSDNLITGNGPGSSLEFCLAIVEALYDEEKVKELAKNMVIKDY
mmetsp:Transcript_6563/g.5641  ORF Transcript_6563/g.5641 Transcript_6563/m.5641 type:complete len:144 (+) Transcript_6563:180-611(+)